MGGECEYYLAEDDASQADSIKTWLEMDGYSVDWVERGYYMLFWLLEQHHYDCVLLDRGLPKVTGEEILKRLSTSASTNTSYFYYCT